MWHPAVIIRPTLATEKDPMEKRSTHWPKPGRLMLLGSFLLAGAVCAQGRAPDAPAASAKLDKAKLSYAIGYQIGDQFADGKPEVDIPTLQRAIQDAYAKRRPAVPMPQMHEQLQLLAHQMHSDALTEYKRIAVDNARKSSGFMATNAQQKGVVQLPSGIQYSVITKGTGTSSPGVTSTVVVNYRGMLIDGTEFDSTWAHGAPASMTVDKMIRGWQDVIPRMHVGDRWKVVIPPQLAYGETGALPRIGPNEALVFEIQLLDIKPQSDKP
jgi:FKBP-type peptidyl-prolyl cis-trans isomerase FklB